MTKEDSREVTGDESACEPLVWQDNRVKDGGSGSSGLAVQKCVPTMLLFGEDLEMC